MNKQKASVIALAILAVFLRLFRWSETFVFNAEYNYKLWPMQKILVERDPTLIGIEAVSYLHHLHYPPFFLYMFAPVLAISQFNPAGIELFFIFFSGVTTVVFYLLGRELAHHRMGLMFAGIYAVSFFAQRADRFIWVVGPVLFFTALFLLVLLKALKKAKFSATHGSLLGGIIGLGLNFHYQMGVVLVAFVLLLLINAKVRSKFSTRALIAFVAGILFFFSPLILFELRNNFYNLEGVRLLLTYSAESPSLSRRITSTFAAFTNIVLGFFISHDSPTSVITNRLALTVPTALLTVYVLWQLYKSMVTRRLSYWYQFMLLMVGVGITTFFFLRNSFNYYLFVLQPILLVFLGVLFFGAWYKKHRALTLAAAALFLAINIYRTVTYQPTTAWKQQLAAAEVLVQPAKNGEVTIHYQTFPSEEHAFLLYYAARKNNVDFGRVKLFEPWDTDVDTDFIVTHTLSTDHTGQRFGDIGIEQKNKNL